MLANRGALESPLVQADMIDASEFRELAVRYNVSSVPLSTVNDHIDSILGAVPEEFLIREIQRISNHEL